MENLQQQVKKAYMNAGLSENQANIITAEVGRENSFDPNVLFGMHTDPKNSATNVGMLSWQGSRAKGVYARLKSKGLIDKDSKIIRSQDALDEMAKFSVNEMNNDPAYSKTKNAFLKNPNVDYNTANKVLGTDYVRWRYNDPEYKSGHKNRDKFYEQVSGFKMPKSRYKSPVDNQPAESTYSRVKRSFDQQQAPSIANIYYKYAQGKLNPQQTKDFEDDVRSGAIMLPRGASLKSGLKQNQPIRLSQKIADSVSSMNSQQRADLQADIDAGLVTLPIPSNQQSSLPDFNAQGQIIEQPATVNKLPEPKQEVTNADRLRGGLETAGALATGATTGAIGYLGGTAQGIGQAIQQGTFGTAQGAENIAKSAAQGMQAGTYTPRTATGQQYLENVGQALEPLAAFTPAGAELNMIRSAAKGAQPIIASEAQRITDTAKAGAQTVGESVGNTYNRAKEGLGFAPKEEPTPMSGIGAADVDQATVRQALAQDLPYSPELTKGQVSRDSDQLKFEKETSKQEVGADIRKRYEQQHENIQMNMEKFNEMTGAEKGNTRDVGLVVDKALNSEFEKDRAKTRDAYKVADKSEEAKIPVDLTKRIDFSDDNVGSVTDAKDVPTTNLIEYLNDQVAGASEPILDTAKNLAVKQGIAIKDINGNLLPAQPTIKQMENFRKDIIAKTDSMSAPDVRQSTIIKKMIDSHTEPYEGSLYKQARTLRRNQANRWESNKIVTDLMSNKKGTEDRKVALEDVVDRIVNKGSLDDMRVAKRLLLTSGDDGKQAWKEVQGATLRKILDEATSGVAPDAQGKQMVSPSKLNTAINRLDEDNKLNYLLGTEGASKLRALNDISKAMLTFPESAAINNSNTSSAIIAALDLTISATSGLPAPVATALRIATRHIKDRKIKARVNDALNLKDVK